MANYLFTHYATYLNGSLDSSGALMSPTTLDDGEPDATFEIGDIFNIPSFGGTYNYVGTSQIGGKTWPAYEFVGPPTGYHVVFLDEAPISPPNSLSFTPAAFPTCFAAGTLIATPTGEVAVETLQTGDLILTAAGDPEPVRWLARQTVMTRFRPAERLLPVRFAAGALGHGLPHSDLTVTADHALLIDGILCHAGALVNGTSITRVPLAELGDSFTVYHIETAAHEIILANGAATETFIDNVSRRSFDNYAEFQALYGDSLHMAELPLPRAVSARQVPQDIRTRLTDRHVA